MTHPLNPREQHMKNNKFPSIMRNLSAIEALLVAVVVLSFVGILAALGSLLYAFTNDTIRMMESRENTQPRKTPTQYNTIPFSKGKDA